MAKALAGVKYGRLTSAPKERPHTRGAKKGGGRAGPPMVDIGSKQGARRATPSHRFAKVGHVSERHGGGGSGPSIGKQSGHGGFREMGIGALPNPPYPLK